MNIEEIKKISESLTEESMLQFKDGLTVKGAIEVSTVIMNCCEEYNNGYLEGRNKMVAAFVGTMILGGAIGGMSVIIAKKTIKKLNSNKQSKEERA